MSLKEYSSLKISKTRKTVEMRMKAISKRKDKEKVKLRRIRLLKKATMSSITQRKNLEKEHRRNDSFEFRLNID